MEHGLRRQGEWGAVSEHQWEEKPLGAPGGHRLGRTKRKGHAQGLGNKGPAQVKSRNSSPEPRRQTCGRADCWALLVGRLAWVWPCPNPLLAWQSWTSYFTSHFMSCTELLKGSSEMVCPKNIKWLTYICCCSVTKSCLTLCDPMDCSMPGFSDLHHLLEIAQTHVHWVSDANQPSHPLSPPYMALTMFHDSQFPAWPPWSLPPGIHALVWPLLPWIGLTWVTHMMLWKWCNVSSQAGSLKTLWLPLCSLLHHSLWAKPPPVLWRHSSSPWEKYVWWEAEASSQQPHGQRLWKGFLPLPVRLSMTWLMPQTISWLQFKRTKLHTPLSQIPVLQKLGEIINISCFIRYILGYCYIAIDN